MILGLGCSRRHKMGRNKRLRQFKFRNHFYRCLYCDQGEIRDLGPKVSEIRKCATELTHIKAPEREAS